MALILWLGVALAMCGDDPVVGELLCADVVRGDLAEGAERDWQYACGSPYPGLWQTGPDQAYTWICPAAGEVVVTLSDLVCDLDLYLLDGTCDAETGCLAGDTHTELGGVQAFTTCLAPGDLLHVMVEGYGLAVPSGDCLRPDAGTYTLSFDLTAGVCSNLEVRTPTPGLAGTLNDFEVIGGTPGETVTVLAGFSPGSTRVAGCPGLLLGAGDVQVVGRARARADGRAVVERRVPASAIGRVVTLHAVEQRTCRSSPAISHTW